MSEQNTPDHAKDIADLKAQNADLLARLDKLEPKEKPKEKVEEDPSLAEKVKKEQEAKDKRSADAKSIESALKFSLGSAEFIKTNGALLPKEVAGIFAQADKEKYDGPVEKDAAIKSEIIQSFFLVQENLDLLTAGQKTTLEEYLKLTKNGKQEKAQQIYDIVFEPALEMLKRVKKAEELTKAKGGFSTATDAEKAYKEKLMGLSKKHYLNEKGEK
jgi:hypothetical protein